MRLIYVTAALPWGVNEPFIIPELRELRHRGHEIRVVPRSPSGLLLHGDARDLRGISVATSVLSPRVAARAAAILCTQPILTARAFAPLVHSRSLSVLAKNAFVAPKGLWLANLATQWGADHIHSHWAGTTATIAMVASRLSGIPFSVTAHRWDISENNLLTEKSRAATFIRTIDEPGAAELARLTGGAEPVVIHMGVKLPDRRAYRESEALRRAVIPARLVEKKGHSYLLDALAQLSNAGVALDLDIAGDGPLRATLERRVAELGLQSRVQFLGHVPHDELLARMGTDTWGVVVLPSIVADDGSREGIPVALMEAMSFGIPVVSTDTGGISELVTDGAGLLVPDRDAGALAAALTQLVSNPAVRNDIARRGQERVVERFTIERAVDRLEDLFRGKSVAG